MQDLGLYPIQANLELLAQMQIYQYQVMFIGLIFDVIVILFVIVAILLIYSLLLISVETKTFDIGIMRLVGLSTNSFIGMIFTQSFLFVAPGELNVLVSLAHNPGKVQAAEGDFCQHLALVTPRAGVPLDWRQVGSS